MAGRLYEQVFGPARSRARLPRRRLDPDGGRLPARCLDEEASRGATCSSRWSARAWLLRLTRKAAAGLTTPTTSCGSRSSRALTWGLPVLVVRVDDVPVLVAEDLPPGLARLAGCPAFPLRHDPLFHADVARLLDALGAARPARRRIRRLPSSGSTPSVWPCGVAWPPNWGGCRCFRRWPG